jgi:hypothetical protein
VTREGLHRTPHNESEIEAREQSSDPKPKKIQSWKGMERRKDAWRKRGG